MFKAIEDIMAMGAHRSLQFGLIDKTWSEKELDHLEALLFAGFRIVPTAPLQQSCMAVFVTGLHLITRPQSVK